MKDGKIVPVQITCSLLKNRMNLNKDKVSFKTLILNFKKIKKV